MTNESVSLYCLGGRELLGKTMFTFNSSTELQASLIYILNSRTAMAMYRSYLKKEMRKLGTYSQALGRHRLEDYYNFEDGLTSI